MLPFAVEEGVRSGIALGVSITNHLTVVVDAIAVTVSAAQGTKVGHRAVAV